MMKMGLGLDRLEMGMMMVVVAWLMMEVGDDGWSVKMTLQVFNPQAVWVAAGLGLSEEKRIVIDRWM